MTQIKTSPNNSNTVPTRRNILSAGFGTGSLLLLTSLPLLQACTHASSSHTGRKQLKNKRLSSDKTVLRLRYDHADGFRKLNEIRRKHNLREFSNDPRLQKAAQDYANLMGSKGLYGHEIGPGTDFRSRIFAVGFNNSSGENIGVGYRSIDDALIGWIESPGHRKNMLKRKYNLAGLAYGFNTSGKNPRYTHYWVLIMGKGEQRMARY